MYNFDIKEITQQCVDWIKDWFDKNGPECNAVIGLSGGKDSTIVAALCARALGPERVIGVSMPDVNQGLNNAKEIADFIGIKFINAPIDWITNDFYRMKFRYSGDNFAWSDQAVQNIPPRVRMTMLYALAQTHNGMVVGTCNKSETEIGYETLYGDQVSSMNPIANLTVEEVKQIGYELGVKKEWVDRIPDDGLPLSAPDEEKLGFTYKEVDDLIRLGIKGENYEKIMRMHRNSQFKRDIVNIPSFNSNLPNNI